MNTLYVMVGIPGSGKSYWADNYIKTHPNTVIVSADAIRKEWYGDVSIQGNGKRIFEEVHRRIRNELEKGNDVIADNTSVSPGRRNDYMSFKDKANVVAVYMDTEMELAITSNENRERKVPVNVIENMKKSLVKPEINEGFTEIITVKRDRPLDEIINEKQKEGYKNIEKEKEEER